MTGCGGGAATPPQAAQSGAQKGAPQRPTDPAAQVTYDFLQAVIRGDTDAATGLLTPTAIERFNATGSRFAPPGLASARFRLGDVAYPAPGATEAAVQCMVTDQNATEGSAREEELACLLKQVAGQWRVSGMAYEVAADQPPMVLDFEKFAPQGEAAKPAVDPARTAAAPEETQTK
ncbi:hypothetical protein Pla175_51920 [Pirellulimonas nuda]|uniref:Lumazine-binding domain protein n=2 Tax=Pirellulimonas nuda TaxID=2528009 RepID=A0A518DJV9_9BACT|nr:hypothetical protein Pla175_51920 [Pirellulimonas nuda]